MPYNLTYLLSVITAVVESVLFAGICFGWSSISVVFREEGYFSSQCPHMDNTTASHDQCTSQENNLILVFTLANFIMKLLSFPLGISLDKLGTFITRCMGTAFITTGAIIVAVSSPAASVLLYPAICCFMVGGLCLFFSGIPLGNLFPSHRSFFITLLNGAFGSSAVTFLVAKLAYDGGTSVETIFFFITALTAFIWIRTVFLMPMKNIPFNAPSDFKLGALEFCKKGTSTKMRPKHHGVQNESDLAMQKLNPATEGVDETKIKISFYHCLRSSKFWLNAFHLCILALRVDLLSSQSGPWLKSITGNNTDEFNTYVNVFGIIQFLCVFISPFNGLLVDKLIVFYKKKHGSSAASRKALSVSLMTTSLLGVLFSVTSCIEIPFFVYISFVLQVAFRTFLYGGNASYISMIFPDQHFGKLMGITQLHAGTVSLLQFPLGALVLGPLQGDFLYFHIALVLICLLTIVHPIVLYVRASKME